MKHWSAPLVPVLAAMERTGIKVGPRYLSRMSNAFPQENGGAAVEIHELAGGDKIHVGSPKQLGEILFDKMYAGGRQEEGKTGAYATGADILEDLAAEGPRPARPRAGSAAAFQAENDLTPTRLQDHNHPETGRRAYHLTSSRGAVTGRLSFHRSQPSEPSPYGPREGPAASAPPLSAAERPQAGGAGL